MAGYVASPREWVSEQVRRYEESDGAEANDLRGMPVIIVTNTGHKTGHIRKTPLMRVRHGDRYVIIASMGGAPEHPLWYHNIVAHPDVTLRDRDQLFEVRARLLEEGEERDAMWASAVAAYPDYAAYQERTERQIPVFVLEPR